MKPIPCPATKMKNPATESLAEGLAPAGSPPRAGTWAWLVATFFGTGRLRPGPGSWGSAATILLWWILTRWIQPSWQTPAVIALAIFATVIGIPAATRVARETRVKDPQFVVIDEVVGQLITLIAAPVTWKTLLACFLLFRAFDILKPPPIRLLERLPEGTGIVVDDIGAAVYALAMMQILLHFRLLS
jgi:phosphatidylglycerophosphatase A